MTGDTFTIYRCRVCRAYDWAPEEVVHARHACPGETDTARIDCLTLVPVDADVPGDPRLALPARIGPRTWAA